MDANGLKFWMLADERDWKFVDSGLEYDRPSKRLRLALQGSATTWPASKPGAAEQLIDRIAQSVDRFGTRAFWSPSDGKVMATGADTGNVALFTVPTGSAVTDVAIGYDDMLYLAVAGGVTIVDVRQPFKPVNVPMPEEFTSWRLAADPAGGAWVLDRAHRRLGRVIGRPSTIRPHPPYSADVFRPIQENPDPQRLVIIDTVVFDDGDEKVVALASSNQGRLALLCWKKDEFARLRLLDSVGNLQPPVRLAGAAEPYSLAWFSANQIALLVPGITEALVYTIDQLRSELLPDGAVYPLRNHDGGPFAHGVTLPPSYPTTDGTRPLYQLSLPVYAREGWAENAVVFDSGSVGTTWHRLYLEMTIPDDCGVVVRLATTNAPDQTPAEWHDHQFGALFAPDGRTPRGSWVSTPSEIAFHQGLLDSPVVKDRCGLFTVLIQRIDVRVRALRGRYLKLHIGLIGNALKTPEVAALRAYGSRFSYVNHYLPELYREDTFGPDGDAKGSCTPADFLERFLDNFESVLTPLEDRIANSYLLTAPETIPSESLDWLGGWIGVSFDAAYDAAQRRQLLASTPELYRRRGTLRGLGLALDIATGGAVALGRMVVVENYRLRRTFATILGANLDDANDPLLAGLSNGGNSYVGETLFLGNEHREEFLALFSSEMPETLGEPEAVEAFFDEQAFRVTILVHEEIEREELALVRRIAAQEVPAHVAVSIVHSSNAFRAGVAALVGVDSYLAPKPPLRPVRVDESLIGGGDVVMRPPALDPRLTGDNAKATKAVLVGPSVVEAGKSFTLSGGVAKNPDSRKAAKYIWKRLD